MTRLRRPLPLVSETSGPAAEPAIVRPLRIAMVNMPWSLTDRPSIQCGLLKACLTRAGHQVDVHYLNLDLAALIGARAYARIAGLPAEHTLMLGDWLFSHAASGAAFSGILPDENAYRSAFPVVDEICEQLGIDFARLRELRCSGIPSWLEKAMAAVDWPRYDLVGFTSTFEQNVASIAAAAWIKRIDQKAIVVFGGANLDGEIGLEYLRCYRDIDYVVAGEGDFTFPLLAAAVSRGEQPLGIPGVAGRANGAVTAPRAQMIPDMDSLARLASAMADVLAETSVRDLWRALGEAGLIARLFAGGARPSPAFLGALLTALDARFPVGTTLGICVQVGSALPILLDSGGDDFGAVRNSVLAGKAVVALAATD